jgi:hypothetical protein
LLKSLGHAAAELMEMVQRTENVPCWRGGVGKAAKLKCANQQMMEFRGTLMVVTVRRRGGLMGSGLEEVAKWSSGKVNGRAWWRRGALRDGARSERAR